MEDNKEEEMSLELSNLTEKELSLLQKMNYTYDKKRRKELIKLEERKRQLEIREISNQCREEKEKVKKSTTKILMAFILGNCTIVEIYSMIVMFLLHDISALYSLIGAVVGESISFAIYCTKSYKENKEEAINRLERDKFLASIENESNYCEPDESDNYPIGDETRDLTGCM